MISIHKNIMILLPVFLLLLLVFNSLNLSFITHDDFNFFMEGNIEFLSKYYDTLGRPIAALFLRSSEHLHLSGFSDLYTKIRLPLIFILTLSIYLSVKFFDYWKVDYHFSVPFSVALFLLPQTGVQLIWLQTAPGLISTTLGLAAVLTFLQWMKNGAKFNLFLTGLLICFSLMTYPSSTFIFALFSGIGIVLCLVETKALNRKLIFGLFLFISLFTVYFLLVKFGLQPFLKHLDIYVEPFNQSNVFSANINVIEKGKYLLFQLLPRLLAFHNLQPTLDGKLLLDRWDMLFTLTLLFISLLSLFFVANKICGNNFDRVSGLCFFVVTITFLITIVPSTVPQSPAAIYRILLPPTGLLLFVIMFASFHVAKSTAANRALFAVLFIAVPSIITQNNIAKHVQALNLEYEYVRARITNYLNEKGEIPRNIFFVYEPWWERELSYNSQKTAEEYNWIGQSEFIFGAVNSIFGELLGEKIQITHRKCPRFKFQSCINYAAYGDDSTLIRTFHATAPPKTMGENDLLINARDLMPITKVARDNLLSESSALRWFKTNPDSHKGNILPRVLSYEERFKPFVIEIEDSIATVSTDVFFGGHGLDRAFDKSTAPDSFWESWWLPDKPANVYVTTDKQISEMIIESGELITKEPSHIDCYVKQEHQEIYSYCGSAKYDAGKRGKLTLTASNQDSKLNEYKFVLHPRVPGQMRLYEITLK